MVIKPSLVAMAGKHYADLKVQGTVLQFTVLPQHSLLATQHRVKSRQTDRQTDEVRGC